jgi:predicted ATPase
MVADAEVPGRLFVGRERELEELSSGLADARAGRGRLFLLVGEAGIGKTRLADELARRAVAGGARVLWGRCWEGGGAPAYWPWTQVLRAYVRETPVEVALAQMGAGAPDLAQISPILRAQLGAAASDQPDQARFGLFDSLTSFLHAAAAARPLVLVLDDLHAADEASLRLLQFVARELRGAALLVVGTYRDADLRRAPALLTIVPISCARGRGWPCAG